MRMMMMTKKAVGKEIPDILNRIEEVVLAPLKLSLSIGLPTQT